MKFNGFIGGSNSLNSVSVDAQRCVNMYPEIVESGTGKEGQTLYLKSTPGIKKIIEIGDGACRLVHIDPKGRVFLVIGSEIYKTYYNGSVWTTVKLGDLSTAHGFVKAASSVVGDDDFTVFVDGFTCYLYEYIFSTSTETFGTFASYGYVPVNNATGVTFIDGYYIFCDGSNQFYVSDLNSLTIDALSFASSEGSPDNIVGLIANNRDLIIFNQSSTEFYTNTGNADFPFERASGGFIEKGCLSAGSICKIDGYVIWLGRDSLGQGMVYASKGIEPTRLSTHAVEQSISKATDIELSTAYTYQKDGHSFYALNISNTTWVFDLSTKMWHERCYTNEGNLERHRVNNLAYLSSYGFHIAGDYQNNKVYVLDDETYTDDDMTITRMRIFPHLSAGSKYVFYNSLLIDMQVGVGLDGDTQGSNPLAMLSYSDDGGRSFKNEQTASVGKIGEYKKRLIWRRLGRSRDRVFKLKITDPVPVVLMNAEIEIVVGAD